jgi:23S rRNA maturation-related 3'-5' exoribonuclease YhaM
MSVTKQNFEDMVSIAEKIEFKRDVAKLFEYLVGTDYFYAPAARGHHDAKEGGLYEHSKKVFLALKELNKLLINPYSEETLFIVGFGHDLCKIDIYEPKEQWYKDESNRWQSKPGWIINDKFPLGHGEKSVYLLNKCIELTQEEMLAIRWHMGGFEIGSVIDPMVKNSYSAAQKQSLLVRMAHSADLMAVTMSQEEENLEK